jgi:hypothetical protein
LFFTPAVVPVILTENVQDAPDAIVAPARLTALEPAPLVMAPPPQDPVRPLGVETTRPDGRLSVKATPVNEIELTAGLVTVKVSDVVPFSGIDAAPNDLVMLGGARTLRLAVAVLPVPPLVEVTALVVFVKSPEAVPVTLTEKVQELFTARAAALSVTELEPAADAMVPPPHDPVKPFGVATSIPAGNVSVKATPESALALAAGLVIVKVSEVVPLRAMVGAPKDFVMLGGATTEMLAEAVPPVPPSVEVVAPVVLFCMPAAIPVTLTEKEHDALAARLAPDRLMTPVP